MQDKVQKTFESENGRTFVLESRKQTTEADITDLHNLIAKLLVDDYMDTYKSQKTTA